jgi:hypothetical protein
MTDPSDTHSLKGEHLGPTRNRVVTVHDLVWREFEKPDPDRDQIDQAAVQPVDTFTIPRRLEIQP